MSIYNELSGNFEVVAQVNSNVLPHHMIVDHMKNIERVMSPGLWLR